MRRRRDVWAALAVVVTLLVGCGDDSGSSRPVVEVFGPVVGAEAVQLGDVLARAGAAAGVDLRYIGVTSFNQQLDDRLARGDRPAIVLLPQPGRLADLADRGVLQPLPDVVATQVATDVPGSLNALVAVEGDTAAVWLTVDAKGLVWYRPDEFEARGLAVPATLAAFADLAEQERGDDDGVAPFCVDLEAGASTGWVGTDWVESVVLRELGPERYDAWTGGDLRFTSAEIAGVFDDLDALLRRPGAVAGGPAVALATPWESAADALLAADPECLMVHQADFLRREFPPGTTVGSEGHVDFFPLPANGGSPPLTLGGLLAAKLNDGPGVDAALSVLAGGEVAQGLTATGAFVSPSAAVDWDLVDDPLSRRLAELVTSAAVVRFDGSDVMASAVGTGTFWTGMKDFFAGESIDSVLESIDAGWPEP